MSAVLRQLAQLAAAAELHARERHQLMLCPADWKLVDLILNRERQQGDASERESVALCYGAWIGESLVHSGIAEWTGLQEPVPPRLRIGTLCYSPVEAVSRRLTSTDVPTVTELIDRTCARPATTDWQADEWNRAGWDKRADDPVWTRSSFALPLPPEELLEMLDPWLMEVDWAGREVLCLAAAGGTHGPLYAAVGARVTVVDFSPALLAIDQRIADRFQLNLTTICGDLRDLSQLPDRHYDIIIQPVSSCYVADVRSMYREIFRTLKPGGIYLSQHKSPASLQSGSWQEPLSAYCIVSPAGTGTPLFPGEAAGISQREPGMIEFVHSLDELLGGLCRSGFVLEEVSEPVRGDAWSPPGTAAHRAVYVPPYLKLLARRPDDARNR